MSIKKSDLEKKLLYRIAKIFFLTIPVPPFLIFVMSFLIGGLLQEDAIYLGYAVVVLILYYIILNLIWRGSLYIIFGGLENDTRKPITKIEHPVTSVNQTAHSAQAAQVAQTVQTPSQAGPVLGLVFFAFLMILIVSYSNNHDSIFSNENTYGTACTTGGKNGLYGTNGSCYTCSSGSVAVTSPVNNCSDGIGGVYCCNSSAGKSGGSSGSKCVPTGCGTQWNCWGDYYPASGVRTHVSGCFSRSQDYLPSWSGTCRRCP